MNDALMVETPREEPRVSLYAVRIGERQPAPLGGRAEGSVRQRANDLVLKRPVCSRRRGHYGVSGGPQPRICTTAVRPSVTIL